MDEQKDGFPIVPPRRNPTRGACYGRLVDARRKGGFGAFGEKVTVGGGFGEEQPGGDRDGRDGGNPNHGREFHSASNVPGTRWVPSSVREGRDGRKFSRPAAFIAALIARHDPGTEVLSGPGLRLHVDPIAVEGSVKPSRKLRMRLHRFAVTGPYQEKPREPRRLQACPQTPNGQLTTRSSIPSGSVIARWSRERPARLHAGSELPGHGNKGPRTVRNPDPKGIGLRRRNQCRRSRRRT